MNKFLIIIGLTLLLITNSHAVEETIQQEPLSSVAVKNLYLDLMKRCLTNWIYGDSEKTVVRGSNNIVKKMVVKSLNYAGFQLVRPAPMMDKDKWRKGWQMSSIAHTMISLKRLDNLQFCIENVLANKIPGDLIECGAWRGGATIFMRAVLKAHEISNRTVYVADSFEGLPKPDTAKYPWDKGLDFYKDDFYAVSLEQVKDNFDRYNLLDEQVYFLKGWFKDTLPKAPIKQLAVLRVDADLYESTMDCLVNLYPKLSVGGYIIIDDFNYFTACKQAVLDYRKANGITDEIIRIDYAGAYWQKSR